MIVFKHVFCIIRNWLKKYFKLQRRKFANMKPYVVHE